ncbi:hypothetical protein SAMN04487944_10357 [Gracilibacillus ureilyticus]|uniref:Uncharacterized protein n=1 Tax=Gracilibacillus ureilyticus TaxID=531814 RepID=A0A1H9NC43_9BACI|nr:hypothetical protein SAMN04487944_10357 [Gracilibacillus ureilyticus]
MKILKRNKHVNNIIGERRAGVFVKLQEESGNCKKGAEFARRRQICKKGAEIARREQKLQEESHSEPKTKRPILQERALRQSISMQLFYSDWIASSTGVFPVTTWNSFPIVESWSKLSTITLAISSRGTSPLSTFSASAT